MHREFLERWMHDHTFGQDRKLSSERRTLAVCAITLLTMGVEIGAGIAFGSMALLADGLHMGSHASALAVSVFGYRYTRSRARDPRFNFGTGKVNSLAAFASATMLVLFALAMAWESAGRLLAPVPIRFDAAILVAVVGFLVNGVCLVVLGGHGLLHGKRDGERHDHNLRSAILHVLADALTSFLAIFALLGGKYLGQPWLDPFMGLVGAALVIRWSLGLLRSSARVLLDHRAPDEVLEAIRSAIESGGDDRISDLHVWSVGPGIYAAEIAVVSSEPREPDDYYRLLPADLGLVHVTVEVRRCAPAPFGEEKQ